MAKISFVLTEQRKVIQMTNDLISRQAAIDALNGEIEITGRTNAEAVKGYVRLVKDRLERLPSAQPEIIRCKDCKFVGTDATCCLVCNREGMGLRPFHLYHDDFCSYAKRKEE